MRESPGVTSEVSRSGMLAEWLACREALLIVWVNGSDALIHYRTKIEMHITTTGPALPTRGCRSLTSAGKLRGRQGRPGGRLKTLESTVAKLRRGTFRLSQVHDVAGVRVVLGDLSAQEEAVQSLASRYPGSRLLDYREQSQNGYRAVHLVEAGAPVEIQLRTARQDMWANLCEEAANMFDL
ncbi:MAG: RelA/SpoT domain-containing protein [Dehalococcoidia bacterium]|nr:RelA/SpoT domain-containing protein [Dehalococcoidia bacterium]